MLCCTEKKPAVVLPHLFNILQDDSLQRVLRHTQLERGPGVKPRTHRKETIPPLPKDGLWVTQDELEKVPAETAVWNIRFHGYTDTFKPVSFI